MKKQVKFAKLSIFSLVLVTVVSVTFFVFNFVVAQTWQGPESSPPDGNTPGVIFDKSATDPVQSADINITGDIDANVFTGLAADFGQVCLPIGGCIDDWGLVGGAFWQEALDLADFGRGFIYYNKIQDSQVDDPDLSSIWIYDGEATAGQNNPIGQLDVRGIYTYTGGSKNQTWLRLKSTSAFSDANTHNDIVWGDAAETKLNFVYSDWSAGESNIMTLLPSGRVGIGTTNPGESLEVFGGGSILLKDDANDPGDLVFRNSADTEYGKIWALSDGLRFSAQNGPPDLMIMNSTGRVGIGTESPAQALHVTGNIRTDGRNLYFGSAQRLSGDNSSKLNWRSNHVTVSQIPIKRSDDLMLGALYGSSNTAGTAKNFGLLDAGGKWSYLAVDKSYTSFRIDGDEKMRINSAGSVGIGTNVPAYPLDILAKFDSSRGLNVLIPDDLNAGTSNYAGYFQTQDTLGAGVRGIAGTPTIDVPGGSKGVYGSGPTGVGGWGIGGGAPRGVQGYVDEANGFGGYFFHGGNGGTGLFASNACIGDPALCDLDWPELQLVGTSPFGESPVSMRVENTSENHFASYKLIAGTSNGGMGIGGATRASHPKALFVANNTTGGDIEFWLNGNQNYFTITSAGQLCLNGSCISSWASSGSDQNLQEVLAKGRDAGDTDINNVDDLRADRICLGSGSGVCRTDWPSGGGGGGAIDEIRAEPGSGITVSNGTGPIVTIGGGGVETSSIGCEDETGGIGGVSTAQCSESCNSGWILTVWNCTGSPNVQESNDQQTGTCSCINSALCQVSGTGTCSR